MIGFFVSGVPAPQGSKRASVGKSGKAHMYEQSAKTLKPWRKAMTDAGVEAMGGMDPLDGSLFLDVTFFMPRPGKSKFGAFPAGAPDLDKLIRAAGDSLTNANVVLDDARFVEIHARKVWAEPGGEGAEILVMTRAEWLDWRGDPAGLAR